MRGEKEQKVKRLVRQCISCREPLTRDNFIRITKNKKKDTNQQTVVINPDKYQFGRSVYICKIKECITKAVREKKIAKLLRTSAKNVEPILPELESLAKTTTQSSVLSTQHSALSTQHSIEEVLI